MKRLAKTKKPPARKRRAAPPRPPAPRRILVGGVAWLSLAAAADRLGVDLSRIYKIVHADEGGLTSIAREIDGRTVRYVTAVSVAQYRRRALAWKQLHGRKHGSRAS